MMISTRGRYALRVMLDMAEHGGGEWHRLSEAAQRLQLSKKYLESIMAALSRANLVESAVGKSGGYRLTRRRITPWAKFCVRRREASRRSRASPKRGQAAAAAVTATRARSGKGWRNRSTATLTVILWRNVCE